MIVELLLLFGIFLFYAIIKDKKHSKLPPGPLEIPFLGNKILETSDQLNEYRKTYGDVFTTRIGVVRTVTICDYKLAKEAMGSIECSDRPSLFKIFAINPEEQGGLISSNGIQWVHDRRFVLRNLRDLGMGKTQLEIAIHEEARALVEHIKALGGKPSGYPKGFRTVALNVIWQLVVSKRYDLDSTEMDEIFIEFEKFRDEQSMLAFAEEFFPVMKYIPKFIRHRFIDLRGLEIFKATMKRLMNESIDEHQKTLDAENPRDLLDDYLIESNKYSGDPNSLFRISALYEIVSDLFGAGTDTITNMLNWVVFYIVKYPEVARRCQEEIDLEVAAGELVSILDKPRIPYVEAFTAEAFRHSAMILMSVPRQTNKDFKFSGYLIPKGTAVQISTYSIHYDVDFWKDPQNFRPERFLDSEGKFQQKLGRDASFGLGRRQCLGEPLAKMEFFLYTSAILQNFTIEMPEGVKLREEVREAAGGRFPHNQQFVFKYRKR